MPWLYGEEDGLDSDLDKESKKTEMELSYVDDELNRQILARLVGRNEEALREQEDLLSTLESSIE